ncbi:MAG: (d)CMP kinase [Clostridiales bacterium]|nr:(d)CMP kinase [Clostridiales bacterium]
MYQIAVDGHSGSGKSSFAKGLAKELGFYHLNTGEIYRAIACAYKYNRLGEPNEERIARFVSKLNVEVKFEEGKQVVYVNGKSYTPYLRLEEISSFTSVISPYKVLRDKVLSVQRDFAEKNDVVMEGRDITSHVLPNADVKIFITADAKARAERRFNELPLEEKSKTTFEEVLADLQERDYRDEHREEGPLVITKDAIILDNTHLTLQETIEKGVEIVTNRIQMSEKE